MKIKIFLIVFFVGNTFLAMSQKEVKGRIVNRIDNKPVSYASVGLVKENSGTTADENGYFLIYSKYPVDSILVSSVGFVNKIIAIANFKNENEIKLDENEKLLNAVIIKNKSKEKKIVLNHFSNCGMNFYDVAKGAYFQVAQYFDAPDSNMFISEINLCKEAGDCIFHIRIYGMDPLTGKPSTDLTDSVIEVKSSKRNIIIDMEKYGIRIPGKGFFIAVEWLFIPYNAYTTKTKLKYVFKSYHPSISFRKKANPETDANNPWILNYNGKWSLSYPIDRNKQFLISATLRH